MQPEILAGAPRCGARTRGEVFAVLPLDALTDVVAAHVASREEAVAWLRRLQATGRYQTEVWAS